MSVVFEKVINNNLSNIRFGFLELPNSPRPISHASPYNQKIIKTLLNQISRLTKVLHNPKCVS